MSKIKFGIGALQAAQENYQIILDRLIRGYQKMMKKDPEGLDLIKIKQEARQRADESAKVVDMEGKTLNPEKPIMGGTQDFGEDIRKIYDEAKGPGKGDEMVEALKSPGARASTEIIEKQIQETFPDIKLFGDETFEEILEIQRTGKHPRMKADGGRINFRTGGPTAGTGNLEGIIGADLTGLGTGLLGGMEGVGALGAPTGLMAGDVQRPTSGYETKEGREQRDKAIQDIFNELPKDMQDMIRDQQMKDIKGQTAGLGIVSGLKGLGLVGEYLINQGRAKIFNKGLDVALRETQQKQIREAAEKAAAARVAALADINRNLNLGGYQSDFAQDTDFMSGSGTAAEMGSFARGGLATMFTRKR